MRWPNRPIDCQMARIVEARTKVQKSLRTWNYGVGNVFLGQFFGVTPTEDENLEIQWKPYALGS